MGRGGAGNKWGGEGVVYMEPGGHGDESGGMNEGVGIEVGGEDVVQKEEGERRGRSLGTETRGNKRVAAGQGVERKNGWVERGVLGSTRRRVGQERNWDLGRKPIWVRE